MSEHIAVAHPVSGNQAMMIQGQHQPMMMQGQHQPMIIQGQHQPMMIQGQHQPMMIQGQHQPMMIQGQHQPMMIQGQHQPMIIQVIKPRTVVVREKYCGGISWCTCILLTLFLPPTCIFVSLCPCDTKDVIVPVPH